MGTLPSSGEGEKGKAGEALAKKHPSVYHFYAEKGRGLGEKEIKKKRRRKT